MKENVHVYPINDLRIHALRGIMCLCNPILEDQGDGTFIVVHNSWDNREAKEEGRKPN